MLVLKVWLLVNLAAAHSGPSPHMFKSKEDCMRVVRALERDGGFQSNSSATCVFTTVVVAK